MADYNYGRCGEVYDQSTGDLVGNIQEDGSIIDGGGNSVGYANTHYYHESSNIKTSEVNRKEIDDSTCSYDNAKGSYNESKINLSDAFTQNAIISIMLTIFIYIPSGGIEASFFVFLFFLGVVSFFRWLITKKS